MKNKKIAVTIQNMVQFYSIKLGIDKLIELGHKVDIFIPIYEKDQLGYCDMYEKAYDNINKINKYNIKRNYDGEKYKIVLTPYDMGIFYKFNTDYNIKYKYAVSAKPNLTLKPEENILYDGILCYSTWEKDMLSVYAPTYNVGNIKFHNFKRKKTLNKKPILLYLPTYGNYSSIDLILKKLKELKENYTIITKIHHGTSHLKNEKQKKAQLEDICDVVYDENYELTKLLEFADVVISDNSGSIFEALYANVPVAVFSENADLSLGDIQPLQKRLIDSNIIPFTNNVNELSKIIKKATNKEIIAKQNEISRKLFTVKNEELVEKFINVINIYLNDEINKDYYYLHKELLKYIDNIKKVEKDLISYKESIIEENKNLEQKMYNMQNELNDYRSGKLYKISKKIYRFMYLLKNRW